MTVISAMKFSPTQGALVADAQMTYGYRKSEISTKLYHLFSSESLIGIVGGAGAADILYDCYKQALEPIEKNKNKIEKGKDLANILTHVMAEVKRQYVEGYLQSQLRLSEADLQVAQRRMDDDSRKPLDSTLIQRYHLILNGNDPRFSQYLFNGFLLLTYNKDEGIQLFDASMEFANPIPISRPFHAVGSGSDMVDVELNEFFETVAREKRQEIDPIKGISALLAATDRASARNVGVSGTPLLHVVKDGKVLSPSEESSRLALEVVKGCRKGLLNKEFEQESLDHLIYKAGSAQETEEKMWQITVDRRKLSLLLRGYRA